MNNTFWANFVIILRTCNINFAARQFSFYQTTSLTAYQAIHHHHHLHCCHHHPHLFLVLFLKWSLLSHCCHSHGSGTLSPDQWINTTDNYVYQKVNKTHLFISIRISNSFPLLYSLNGEVKWYIINITLNLLLQSDRNAHKACVQQRTVLIWSRE